MTSFYSDDSAGNQFLPQPSLLGSRSADVTSASTSGNCNELMFYQHLDVEKEMQNLASHERANANSSFASSSQFLSYADCAPATIGVAPPDTNPRRSRLAAKFDLGFQEHNI